ncbi:multidrug resistance-associated ABC transporter [Auriscalpium vulgare]|uniref:Multidrug resistance-associated ABC transporter n=1 Tax=Auriscalpium vulgare TaxID=40419 RepID=A0ACB8S262_9AGAM|nr:multidrug resistance-associated ABC transporter [Auriscalpium vulgare]
MPVCPGHRVDDLENACVRTFWSTVIPGAFVFLLCVASIPLPAWLFNFIRPVTKLFRTYLTLTEAEALDTSAEAGDPVLLDEDTSSPSPELSRDAAPVLWKTLVLAWVALLETLVWLAVGLFYLIQGGNETIFILSPFIAALAWLYATVRPVLHPKPTPSYDLFSLYAVFFGVEVLSTGGILYDKGVQGIPLPPTAIFAAHVANLTALVILIATVLSMPINIPSERVDESEIGKSVSPEDFTSLWGWVTFSWVWPLIKRGTRDTLNEKDVWSLSPTIQSRPIFIKFNRTLRSTLLLRLCAANSLDIMLDFTLSVVSVIFTYAGPYFLKQILDSITTPTPETRSQAYIFAVLAFLCNIAKTQADLQHLWFARRAATRVRSELMASIYDKALKRKDFSGIVEKDMDKGNASDGRKRDKSKDDDPKAGADVGKIVNLMAGDANRVSMMFASIYLLYASPFEVIIGSVFLYKLLGWSAFAGFLTIGLAWPLNSMLTKQGITINKGLSASRDKRMGVVNELIGAVKFIKFFAWEDRWIARVEDARKKEMSWLIKSRVNGLAFNLLWQMGSFLVSAISLLVFVLRGNELTIGTAFTAIALFKMMRMPLNIIPAWIVQVLQTRVAINRIGTYLEEDEVDEQVSSLKRAHSGSDADADVLGIEDGTFKWNEVEDKNEKEAAKKYGKKPSTTGLPSTAADTAVDSEEVDRASLTSETGDHRFELKDISIVFPDSKLTLVTGPTASGKTALLMALLGELTKLSGRIIMAKDLSRVDEHGHTHSISYAAQSPWLRHQSIKDNILFGYPYDDERYQAVIEACALQPDLDILEDGDETEIGARGVNLSGGQKARVALARAIYSRAKYVLLDDPLSAVDSHTARFLFEKLLQGPLLANRTVILVTHHVDLVLPGAHYLVRMLDGRIDTQGTVAELRERGILDEITQEAELEAAEKQATAEEVPSAEEAVANAAGSGEEAAEPAAEHKKPRKLIEDEQRETGGIKWSIYNTYMKASSYWTWVIMELIIILEQVLSVSEKVWMKTWGEAYGSQVHSHAYSYSASSAVGQKVMLDSLLVSHNLAPGVHNQDFTATSLPRAQDHPLFYIGIYAALTFGLALFNVLTAVMQFIGGFRASKVLFTRLLDSVVRSTMRWHDTTPQGRILNRFSKDVETVDNSLPMSLHDVNKSFAIFAASVITVTFIFPLFLVPAFAIGLAYRALAIGYLNTGRDLRRMESNSRSPIFSGFSELLEGIVTVRAFSAEQRFLDGLHSKIDLTTQMWYSFWMTNRWLLLNFDTLGAVAVFITTLFALSGYISAGLAGVCITSAMTFTLSIYQACSGWTGLELDLNSVERLVEYLDLPQEPPAIIESARPPAYWPSSESNRLIVVEDLVVKYAPDLPAVLHDVSFSLKGRERVGLLGRTGSGKSTLAMSILRFTDPTSGRILIDGIDITKIGVHDLRSRLTFIPQDAPLFSGTLRENLDPFNEHDDIECLDVLFRVQMITESAYQSQRSSRQASRAGTRPSSPSGNSPSEANSSAAPSVTDVESKAPISLETQVSAGGVNFSQGQRQLIAMARALLRHSSIIVLDEATSSIDFATDSKIQATIREEFGSSLLLTVAHRLKTVIDYDRLIILDKGSIAEFDTPWNLIRKEDGIFRSMCQNSGTFAELEQAAKDKAAKDGLA